MYSLRQVLSVNPRLVDTDISRQDSGIKIVNTILGNDYSFFHKDSNIKAWNELFSVYYQREPGTVTTNDSPEVLCRAFVVVGDGRQDQIHPLYTHSEYYIVMPNGQTYERLQV